MLTKFFFRNLFYSVSLLKKHLQKSSQKHRRSDCGDLPYLDISRTLTNHQRNAKFTFSHGDGTTLVQKTQILRV